MQMTNCYFRLLVPSTWPLPETACTWQPIHKLHRSAGHMDCFHHCEVFWMTAGNSMESLPGRAAEIHTVSHLTCYNSYTATKWKLFLQAGVWAQCVTHLQSGNSAVGNVLTKPSVESFIVTREWKYLWHSVCAYNLYILFPQVPFPFH